MKVFITRRRFSRLPFLSTGTVAAIFLLCVLFFSCGKSPASLSSVPLERNPEIVSGTLPDGVSYHILRNSRPENRLLFRLVVKAGSVLEDDDQRGLAHLVEHLAFSSTAHFGENELIHYFESIGTGWGPDLNAYTAYDETVYQLEIPADDEEILTTGLTVLWDWAFGVTFDDSGLQKERDIVVEEWRQRRGFQARVQDKLYPFIFSDSRYSDRSPIGDPEIVKNAPKERVVDFYRKWYKSDLLSLVIVGDADPKEIENALTERFSHLDSELEGETLDDGTQTERSRTEHPRTERPSFSVPIPGAQKALVVTDPESSYPMIQLYELFEAARVSTEADYKKSMMRQIASNILTERFSEKIEQEGTPLVYADSSFYHIIRPLSATSTVFIPKDGQFDAAFKSVLDEMDRFAKFGITADELERQKQNLLTDARLAWQNRDKTESKALIESLIGQVLYDTPLMSPDAEYELAKKTIDGITLGEIKKTVKTYFGSRGKALVVTAPENVLPEQSDIEAIWKNYKSPVPLKPPAAASGERPFFEPPAGFSRGSITAEKNLVLGNVSAQSDAPTVTELALSNGATVIVCPTEFNADTFLFTAITRGGLSLLTDEESLSAARSADYLELSGLNGFPQADITKMLAGKQLSIYPHITQTTASLTGSASTTDIETYFQFIYLYFTAPYFTQSAWERLLSNELIEIQGRKNYPRDVFFDELIAYIYNNSLRYVNPTEETLKLLDANRAEQFYRRYFGDAGKFTFIFTGDVDIDEIKQLSETYIAQIPSESAARSDEARVTANPFPAGKKTLVVKKGLEEQAEVCVIAGGENHEQIDPPQIEAEMVSIAGQLAETRLTEALRLRLGSVYGVGVDLSVANYPARRYFSEIIFNCEPARVDELIAVVNDELQKLRASPPTADEITMLKETFARKRETAVKTNNFWHGGFARNIGTRRDVALFARDAEVLARITPQNIQRYMRVYLGLDNAVTGILLPEQSR